MTDSATSYFDFVPSGKDPRIDWDSITDRFEWFRTLAECPQDPHWHSEGDVQTHTKMVCEELVQLPRWQALPQMDREILFLSALMHDISKPDVTTEIDGRIRSPKHASRGAQRSRWLFLEKMLPTQSLQHLVFREQVVELIRFHGVPLSFTRRPNPERDVIQLSQLFQNNWLGMLAKADVLGRHSSDREALLEKVALFEELCREQLCWERPREFANSMTRFAFLRGMEVAPEHPLYDDSRNEATILSGLPGAGKDTWLRENGSGARIVSLDQIRESLKVSPEDNQGHVIAAAKEQARVAMRKSEPVIWNATNTSKKLRTQLIQFFLDYSYRVHIVYLETGWSHLLKRNRDRSNDQVPKKVLERLAAKLEVPRNDESHHVEWLVN